MNLKKKESQFEKGICTLCGKGPQHCKGKDALTGQPIYRAMCYQCHSKKYKLKSYRERNGNTPYSKFKKDVCERCGFIPEHSCQLDVDHLDGNHGNNLPENLQTLCANCHRLKTYINKDWEK